MQLVLPEKYRKKPKMECHDDLDVLAHIKNVKRHLRLKAKPTKEPLHPVPATYPLQLVHMDYLTIESPKCDKDVNILIITDQVTHYAQASVTGS